MDFNITAWNRISEDAFKEFAYDAGVVVKNFDPTVFAVPSDNDIVCTTTGNITAGMVPTMSNLGDDVNGIHGQFKELEILESWTATMGFTALETGVNQLKLALGAADITTGNGGVKPRMYIKSTDFETIALIMFKIGGGMCAAVLRNALSTGGLSITTSKSGKANLAVNMTGFQSMNAQDTPAMEFYEADESVTPDIVFSRSNITMTVDDMVSVPIDVYPDSAYTTMTTTASGAGAIATAIPSIRSHAVNIAAVGEGIATITATITVNGVTYSDTCTVTVVAAEDDDT